jgi:hypothetical protein
MTYDQQCHRSQRTRARRHKPLQRIVSQDAICEVGATCDSRVSGAKCYFMTIRQLHKSDQEQGDDHSADMDAPLPPLGVKLAGCRLLSMTSLLASLARASSLTWASQSHRRQWRGSRECCWRSCESMSVLSMRPEVLTRFLMTSRLSWIGLYEE